jgi:hypothetical protein
VVARYRYTTQELAQTDQTRNITPLQTAFIDYPPGGYLLEQSRTAKAFVGVVKASIDQYLTPYLKDGAGVNVDLTGWADSLPIGDHLVYKGEYGDLNRIWYYEPNATTPNTLTLPAQSYAILQSCAVLQSCA